MTCFRSPPQHGRQEDHIEDTTHIDATDSHGDDTDYHVDYTDSTIDYIHSHKNHADRAVSATEVGSSTVLSPSEAGKICIIMPQAKCWNLIG